MHNHCIHAHVATVFMHAPIEFGATKIALKPFGVGHRVVKNLYACVVEKKTVVINAFQSLPHTSCTLSLCK